MSKRKLEFENLKGILIFFVVLGHLTFSFSYNNSVLSQKITSFIYFFHMPIFFIISGFFSQNKINKKSIIKLIIIFIITNFSYVIYDYFFIGTFDLFILKYSSWYILLLLIYRLVIHSKIIQKVLMNKEKQFLIISLLLSIFIGFFKFDLFILRIFENWFLFLIGYFLEKNYNKIEKVKISKITQFIILIFLFSIIYIIVTEYSYNIMYYLGSSFTRKCDFIVRFIMNITNILIFLISIKFISKREIPLLTNFGNKSLYIYMLHRIPTLIITEFIIIDRKIKIILVVIIAFIICVILSSKIIVKIIDIIVDFFTQKILDKSKIFLSIIILILFSLIFFEFYNKNIFNLKYLKSIDKDIISIGFVGDLILLENQVNYSKIKNSYDFDYMFEDTKKYFNETDYTIGVFEGPSDDNQNYSNGNYNDNKEIRINHPSQFIKSIKKSGIDLVTTSNNHVYDRGYSGAIATIDNLKRFNLDFVGTSNEENPQRKIINIYGIKVGILAYTFYSNYPNDSTNKDVIRFMCNIEDEKFPKIKQEIEKDFSYLKANNVDLIIVLPHYGNEFNFDFSKYQENWNEIFIKNGADIIFGDHSHVIGPIKYQNEKVAISSPGNYVNSYNGQDSDISQYIKVYIDKKTKKIIKTTSIPMLAIKKEKGFYPIPLYDLFKKDLNNKRLKEALAIYGKIVMNNEKITLKKEYQISKKSKKEDKLELTEEDKKSLIYQKINLSKNVCFIGDSITEGTMNDNHPWYEYLLDNFDDNKKITNISKGSFTSYDILKEFKNDLNNASCNLAIINIGTNDIRYNMTNEKKYKENINNIIKELKNKPDIILLAPWETFSQDKIIGENILQKKDLYGKYNKELISLAEKENIFYINPIRYIKAKINKNGEDTYLLDGVHPNKEEGIKLYSYSVLRGINY